MVIAWFAEWSWITSQSSQTLKSLHSVQMYLAPLSGESPQKLHWIPSCSTLRSNAFSPFFTIACIFLKAGGIELSTISLIDIWSYLTEAAVIYPEPSHSLHGLPARVNFLPSHLRQSTTSACCLFDLVSSSLLSSSSLSNCLIYCS